MAKKKKKSKMSRAYWIILSKGTLSSTGDLSIIEVHTEDGLSKEEVCREILSKGDFEDCFAVAMFDEFEIPVYKLEKRYLLSDY